MLRYPIRTLLGIILLGLVSVWVAERIMGTSILVRFGGLVWLPVSEDTPFLSTGVRAALASPVPAVSAGAFEWETQESGFETAEIPVLAAQGEVDSLYVARIDPTRFRFALHNDPAGSTALNAWRKKTKAWLIVNGSYYGRDGFPTTPSVLDSDIAGPATYEARHGAFADNGSGAELVDLATQGWETSLAGAENGFVSYPLLLAPDGRSRTPADSNWLANRSFLGQDSAGRIIVGTTTDSFFSLARLADFLKTAPLDLEIALNLDGGPVACQSVDAKDFKRRTCGLWEVQIEDGEAKMLPPMAKFRDPPLPLIIAVYPR